MKWFVDLYLPREITQRECDGDSCECIARTTRGVPPALLMAVECDVPRDEGAAEGGKTWPRPTTNKGRRIRYKSACHTARRLSGDVKSQPGGGEDRARTAIGRASKLSRVATQWLCVLPDMHSKDLRARGEVEQRLYMISAWREAPHLYNDRERAALAWAEAVTRLVDQQVPDAVYNMARQQFGEAELTQLTLAIVAINGWNRFNVAFHTAAGNYKSAIA